MATWARVVNATIRRFIQSSLPIQLINQACIGMLLRRSRVEQWAGRSKIRKARSDELEHIIRAEFQNDLLQYKRQPTADNYRRLTRHFCSSCQFGYRPPSRRRKRGA